MPSSALLHLAVSEMEREVQMLRGFLVENLNQSGKGMKISRGSPPITEGH